MRDEGGTTSDVLGLRCKHGGEATAARAAERDARKITATADRRKNKRQ